MLTAVVPLSGPAEGVESRCVPWWSVTKVALAAAALRLVQDGALTLDGALPGRPHTLRQLLQHRAGLADYGMLRSYHDAVARRDAPWSRAGMRRRVAALPAATGFSYSNVGYLEVAELIEAAASATLDAALRGLVLGPLGLASARLATTADDLADTAWGNVAGYDPGWVYHGLLVGTPGDAARLLHGVLGPLLDPALATEMATAEPVPELLAGPPWLRAGYGLGLMIGTAEGGARFVGHTGQGPGSTIAVYGRLGGTAVAAVAADRMDQGGIEREAMRLAMT